MAALAGLMALAVFGTAPQDIEENWQEEGDLYRATFNCEVTQVDRYAARPRDGEPRGKVGDRLRLDILADDDSVLELMITASREGEEAQTIKAEACQDGPATEDAEGNPVPPETYRCVLFNGYSSTVTFYGRLDDGTFTLLRIDDPARPVIGEFTSRDVRTRIEANYGVCR